MDFRSVLPAAHRIVARVPQPLRRGRLAGLVSLGMGLAAIAGSSAAPVRPALATFSATGSTGEAVGVPQAAATKTPAANPATAPSPALVAARSAATQVAARLPAAKPSSNGSAAASVFVHPCAKQLCAGAAPWHLYGASTYQSTYPAQTGVDNPAGTVALAQQSGLNTLRIINFYDSKKDPNVEPYSAARWNKVDALVAAAGRAGLRVDLSLGDYRNILWNNCIDPYAADWGPFLRSVASRTNTVTGKKYGADPTIALVSLAGEPLQVGSHTFTASGTGQSCTISYTTQELTNFYARSLPQWKAVAQVSVNTGGLGYLNFNSGIDWKTIFALPADDFCDIKTYGGMLDYSSTVGSYCAGLNKPWIDEEFGWQQSSGDSQRAASMQNTLSVVRHNGSAGEAFWNLGNQSAGTSYDIGSGTPLTMQAVKSGAAF